MHAIRALSADEIHAHMPDFIALLQDAVDSGGSISFLPPVQPHRAAAFWSEVASVQAAGTRVVLAAWDEEDAHIIGSVQLDEDTADNGPHRAEVKKLLVHRGWRGRGIAKALLAALEDHARARGRTLLILDTERESDGYFLYRKTGWIEVGVIPNFALDGKGGILDTVYFYKQL